MNKLIMLTILLFGTVAIAPDADAARRLGGGSNVGSQRAITPPSPKTPAQQQAAPATQPQQQPAAGNKWLGPLAGLALGAGLMALFMNNGIAGALGGILMILLIAAAVVFAIRMFRSKMQPAGAHRPMQFSGPEPGAAPSMPRIGADLSSGFGGGTAAMIKRFPPGFDAEQFARHAKLNFTRLQSANDTRDLSTMRDYMTPALYAEIAAQIEASPDIPQKTEVVGLDAEVIDVVTEDAMHIASVRFSGSLRHNTDMLPEAFSEVWHLEKPVDGSSGWLISGIQQDQ